MKNGWTYFIVGISLSVIVGMFLPKTHAASNEKEKPAEHQKDSKETEGKAEPGKIPEPEKSPEVTNTKESSLQEPSKEVSGLKVKVPDSDELAKALLDKQEEIKKKEEILTQLEKRIKEEEDKLQSRIKEFEKTQSTVQNTFDKNKTREDEIYKKLLVSFQKMSPKKASAVIEKMEDTVAVNILLGLKEKSVAEIMDSMNAARATTLSTLIAKRKPIAPATETVSGNTPPKGGE